MADEPRPMIVAEVDEGHGFLCGSTAWYVVPYVIEFMLINGAPTTRRQLLEGIQDMLLDRLDAPLYAVRWYVYDPRPELPYQ